MKRSGFKVRFDTFIAADAKNPPSIVLASEKITATIAALELAGFVTVVSTSRFMLSREVPDEPKAAQAVPTSGGGGGHQVPVEHMPPIPASLKR